MSEINNGGPAFSTLDVAGGAALSDGRLSVWDWFAGNAMQGYLAAFSGPDVRMPTPEEVVRDVTRYADAMLAARASSAQPAAKPEPAAPDAGGWIEWGGGECPVDTKLLVDVEYPDGTACKRFAGEFRWDWRYNGKDGGDIVRYRVVEVRP